MRYRFMTLLGLWVLLFLSLNSAWAEEQHLILKAETALSFDNNLFRLPANTDTLKTLGKSSGAEQIGVTTLSLNFSTMLSMQKIDLSMSVVDYRYQNFDYLNFMSYNYNATLRWSLTPSLHGTLSSDRKETANSFADYTGLKQSNLRTETSTRLDAVYEIDGPWRALAGVSQSNQANQQALLAGGDFHSQSADAGISYVAGTGSSVTFSQKAVQGQYLKRVLPSAGLFDTSFNQVNRDLRAHWVLADNSNADFYIGHINQTHPNYPERDFSGLNTSASMNWVISGKSELTVGQSRTLSSYATNTTNYAQTDKLFVSPTWQISPKSVVRLRHEWSRINYLGAPTTAAAPTRSDAMRDTGLSLYWQPEQRLTFSASLQNANRASNQSGLDYDSNLLSLSAQYSY
jgi:exopolysaccharide biosynthesis operon protein EpsL